MVTAELAGFLEGQIDIHLGTRDRGLRPHSARVAAIRVEPDNEHVVAYVPTLGADAVLEDLNANGQAAMFVGRPPDNRAYQMKGVFAGSRRAEPAERPFVEQHWDSFLESLTAIGIDKATFAHWPIWPAIAVRVRVTAVFSQTPGPGTGAPVA